MPHLIYSVEDDESIGELVRYSLSNEGFEVQTFSRVDDVFVTALKDRIPDVVLLDIMLPSPLSGLDGLKIIRGMFPSTAIKVIVISAKRGEVDKVKALDLGADDYLTKPFSVLELVARVKAHLRKYGAPVADGVLDIGGVRLNSLNREVSSDGVRVELTYKEFEILYMLMRSAGKVVDRDAMLRSIWGYTYVGEARTVDIHIKNLRKKLGSNEGNIVSVRGVGYIYNTEAGHTNAFSDPDGAKERTKSDGNKRIIIKRRIDY